MNKNALTQTLLEMAGQKNVITVHRAFVDFAGGLEAGMMLSQLLYWTPKSKDGWIAKSDAEFQEELCLTRYGVRAARKALESLGILETKIKRFNNFPTVHYRMNLEALQDSWIVWIRTSDCAKSNKRDCPFSDNDLSEIVQTLTETTTETTTEITTEILSAWGRLFPNKPQPRLSSKDVKEKLPVRLKCAEFREGWRAALEAAAASPSCQEESWFNFGFLVRNDENFQKMIDRWMDWKDQRKMAQNGNGHRAQQAVTRNIPEGV